MIGENLKLIRENKNIGVNELSRLSGVNASYISAIERGDKNNPSMKILNKISVALGIPVEELLKEEPLTQEQLDNWDKRFNSEKLAKEVKDIEDVESKIKYIEALIDFADPKDALKFILEQPFMAAYGGYDLKEMSDDEIIELANDMLFAMRLSLEKMKKKNTPK